MIKDDMTPDRDKIADDEISVAVVMISFGRLHLLKQALPSLLSQIPVGNQFVLVENGAYSSGTREWLVQEKILDRRVDALFLHRNHGLSYALKVGIGLIQECGFIKRETPPTHVLVVQDDVVALRRGSVTDMARCLEAHWSSGCREVTGFRHHSQDNAEIVERGGYKIAMPSVGIYVAGCCNIFRIPDAVRYISEPALTDMNAGLGVDSRWQRILYNDFYNDHYGGPGNRAGFYSAAMAETVISHLGERFRTTGGSQNKVRWTRVNNQTG